MKITFAETKHIRYLYNATGQKISKTITDGSVVTITEYLDGYQYIKPNNQPYKLHFFPHAEGYVNTIGGNNYVFNYTDHLGNIRLSYGIDGSTGVLTTLEENNYYPFGLKHENYNVSKKQYDKYEGEPELVTCVNCDYKYKFQEQERQDELGLNWDSFKWRNYDYAIGRFMNIDPLTEKYNTWSPYTFSGNRVIDARELEGLEPHSVHKNLQEAARNFTTEYNGYSIRNNVEVSTQFYKTTDGNYSYASPLQFGGMSDPSQSNDLPEGAVIVGSGHTHQADKQFDVLQPKEGSGNPLINPTGIGLDKIGKYDIQNGSNAPSGDDSSYVKQVDQKSGGFEASYVVTPSGLVYSIKVDSKTGELKVNINYNLSRTNPSDPNSNIRMNQVSPNNEPQVEPKQGVLKTE